MSRNFDDIQLGSLELFCLAAELGSFTAAASAAGVTPAAVSRSIERIERRLGVRLFIRTTRQMRMTDVGQSYYELCQPALEQLKEAKKKVQKEQHISSGLLRISAPSAYAHYRLMPLLSSFRQSYPAISIDIHISTQNIDFAEDVYDLAIRSNVFSNTNPDSGLIARKLEDAELIVVATPEYLDKLGKPEKLEELAKHECIQFKLPSTGRNLPWLFMNNGVPISIETSGGYTCQDDFLAIRTLAKHSAGLIQIHRFTVEKELETGELVEVLTNFGGSTRPFMLLYPYNTYIPLTAKVFIEHLLENRYD